MKRFRLPSLVFALFAATAGLLQAEEMPTMPTPTAEHTWLQQLVGEWEVESEMFMMPGQPPLKGKGTESVRSLSGFWVISEGTATCEGMPGTMQSRLSLGYESGRKKYVGTWIDSMTDYLWKYEGAVDVTGKILTLETEGPSPMHGGKITKFKESIEFKSPDHRVFASQFLGDDGKWTTMVTMSARRKK